MGVGTEGPGWRVPGPGLGPLDTCEDLHGIKQQIQDAMPGQKRGYVIELIPQQ